MRDPELQQIDRRIADTLEELRILRVELRDEARATREEWRQGHDEWREGHAEWHQRHEELTHELRALRAASDMQTEELRRVSATNQIQTDALRVALERIHQDERGHG